MQPSGELQHVLRSLGLARRTAIEIMRRDHADLFALSAQAFGIDEPGSNDHHARLGEYLTERSCALGTLPIEALTQGHRSNVFRDLARRAGFEPDSVEIMEIREDAQPADPQPSGGEPASVRPPHLVYCNYYATGEGVTTFIAVGGTEACAMDAFKQHTPDYFHRGMEADVLGEDSRHDTRRMIRWIPQAALELIETNPPGTTYYYAKLHFNLA